MVALTQLLDVILLALNFVVSVVVVKIEPTIFPCCAKPIVLDNQYNRTVDNNDVTIINKIGFHRTNFSSPNYDDSTHSTHRALGGCENFG